MKRWILITVVAALVLPAAAAGAPGEVRLAVGAFILDGGTDLQINYRAYDSHWMIGYRYVRWVEEWEDWFGGGVTDETTSTMSGPVICYLFDTRSPGTWYVGASLLQWTARLESFDTGEVDSDSVTAPFFGGGYMGDFAGGGYYNLGMFFSGAKIKNETTYSMEEGNGLDVQAQVGFVF